MTRIRTVLALLLSVAGGVLALILLSKHYGVPLLGEAILAVCGASGGCDVVSQSRYAVFLGLPLAAWGLFLYGSLFALIAPALSGGNEAEADPGLGVAFFLGLIAVTIDVVLLGLQAFAIKAFCEFCIATYVVNLLLVASLWPFRRISLVTNFLFVPGSRRSLVAWGVATLAVAASTLAGNSALSDRKELAASSILGVPSLIRAPQQIEKGSVEEQLALAQAEAKKWKDTLDDERKLQMYLNDKARSDFNHTEVAKLDLSHAPAQGAANGPIAVVTFSDFMCPFCRDLAAGLKNYLPSSLNQVQIYYKYFPLDVTCNARLGQSLHPGACELSLGGVCAQENGRFWEYHDKVFAQRWDRATREDVLKIGASVGLDAAKLSACMTSAAAKGILAKDVDEGWRAGVGSTPTMFVNGRKLSSSGVFLLALEEERKRLGLLQSAPAPAPSPSQK